MSSANQPQTFGVVRIGPIWRIVVQGRLQGQYQFRVDAEEAALRFARLATAAGDTAEIVVQQSWGEMSLLVAP